MVVGVFTIPLLWGLGIFSFPIAIIFPGISRPDFWTFFSSIVFLEWFAFGLIVWVCRPNAAEYLQINLNFLKKYRIRLLLGLGLLIVLAAFAPSYLYSDAFPQESLTLKAIGPVSGLERVAFVFLSITAGICEEVMFRGYGISVLERLLKSKDIALILSSAAFMSLHGIAFLPWYLMLQYFMIGLIFGYFFQKYRRLEILILIHFLLDALIAVFVP
ncbi:MAG: type II CAAX endopeptidase family protein [Bacteroidota bacterium]